MYLKLCASFTHLNVRKDRRICRAGRVLTTLILFFTEQYYLALSNELRPETSSLLNAPDS